MMGMDGYISGNIEDMCWDIMGMYQIKWDEPGTNLPLVVGYEMVVINLPD